VVFKGQFVDEDGLDPALLVLPERCASDIGYAMECLGDGAPRCRLCATCAMGYKRKVQDGMARCDVCPKKEENVLLIIAGFVVVVSIMFLLIRLHLQSGGKRTMAEMYQVVIINYLQLSSLTAGMDVPWPNVVEYVFDIQGVISTIGEHLLSPDCELQGLRAADLIYGKQIGYLVLPWILSLVSLLSWWIIGRVQGRQFTFRGFDDRSPSMLDGCVATVVFLLYLLYPTLCRSSFALLMCTTVDGKQYLLADLQEPCYEGRQLTWFFLSTVPQIGMYVVGLPLYGFFIIRKYAQIKRLQHQIVQFRYGMLYSGYRRERWWWDTIIAFRKAAVALITSWLVGELEVHATLGMLGISMVLNVLGNPYTDLEVDGSKKQINRGQNLM
ncbi:MAG: hypothetical protein VXW99_02720, partial [Pseudomonadota bacterium]|nr:hypothetical protein [Pseudomonadota bacterium]